MEWFAIANLRLKKKRDEFELLIEIHLIWSECLKWWWFCGDSPKFICPQFVVKAKMICSRFSSLVSFLRWLLLECVLYSNLIRHWPWRQSITKITTERTNHTQEFMTTFFEARKPQKYFWFWVRTKLRRKKTSKSNESGWSLWKWKQKRKNHRLPGGNICTHTHQPHTCSLCVSYELHGHNQ